MNRLIFIILMIFSSSCYSATTYNLFLFGNDTTYEYKYTFNKLKCNIPVLYSGGFKHKVALYRYNMINPLTVNLKKPITTYGCYKRIESSDYLYVKIDDNIDNQLNGNILLSKSVLVWE